jgi:hypothetical protein
METITTDLSRDVRAAESTGVRSSYLGSIAEWIERTLFVSTPLD